MLTPDCASGGTHGPVPFYGLILGLAVAELLGGFAGMAKEACAKKTAARVAAGDKKATCPLAKATATAQG